MDRFNDPTVGTGEVETHIRVEPDKGEGTTGKFDAHGTTGGTLDEAQGRAAELKDQAAEKARELRDRAGDTLDEAESRAGEMASRARQKGGELMDRAEEKLQESGFLDSAEEYPLAALGIAFGVGFVLAGSGDDESRQQRQKGRQQRGTFDRAVDQVKGALMGGVSAAISHEIRTLVDERGGVSGLFDQLTGKSGSGNAHA